MTPERTTETTKDDAARRAFAAMCDLVLNNERRHEVSGALGLPFNRIRALRRIAWSPMSMGELATTLVIDAPYATVVVDELEALGLVERRPHPTDRRSKIVATTPKGAAAAKRADAILLRPPPSLLELSAAQLDALAEILEAATRDIETPRSQVTEAPRSHVTEAPR